MSTLKLVRRIPRDRAAFATLPPQALIALATSHFSWWWILGLPTTNTPSARAIRQKVLSGLDGRTCAFAPSALLSG